MAKIELILPKMGESVTEATILKWLKSVGDSIAQDESVVEIATDKVDSEIPATHAGRLVQLLFNEGDVVAVGTAMAIIETSVGEEVSHVEVPFAPAQTPAPTQTIAPPIQTIAPPIQTIEPPTQTIAPPIQTIAPPIQTIAPPIQTIAPPTQTIAPAPTQTIAPPIQAIESVPAPAQTPALRFYSPLVLTIAQSEGVSLSQLEAITGTGADGRVTKRDILDFIANPQTPVAAPIAVAEPIVVATQAAAPAPVITVAAAQTQPAPNIEIIEMDRMRRLIADAMVKSKQTSAHVTSFVEADLTNVVAWRNRVKDDFKKREGENLTFTPIFIEAVVKALKDFPMINASIDGNNIIRKKYINLGMAAALPSGNLIVPVIKNADQLNLRGITKQVNDLANRARNGKLKPDEVQDGTYTLSNVGSFGNVMGTPIINQPQVAILAVGAIRKKPVVLETPEGDVIAIRHMMMLSHSYDHRIVDGALGGMFVRRVADYLEQFDVQRTI